MLHLVAKLLTELQCVFIFAKQTKKMFNKLEKKVRQLESLIRLSEALARIHLDPEIKPVYMCIDLFFSFNLEIKNKR